jgi:hypothetical protein
MQREMFHTQEKRDSRLYKPVLCTRKDAWLGHGYYFCMDGVLFSDSPNTEITKFNYRKRIQMVLYNLKCLVSFKLLKEEHC